MDSGAREGGGTDEGNCCTTEASGEEGGHGYFHSSEWLEGLAPNRNHPRALLLQTNERIGLDAEPWVVLPVASDDRGAVGGDAADTYVLDGLKRLGGFGL